MSTTNLTEDLIHKRASAKLAFLPPDVKLLDIAATVCALLNTDGGTVLVGIVRPGEFEPVKDAKKKTREIEGFLRETLTPGALWSVTVDKTSCGDVITVEVPPGNERPYVCEGSIYVRKASKTVAADADSIRRLVHHQSSEPIAWESRPAPGLVVGELDRNEIARTVEEARRSRNYTFADPDDTSAVLMDLGLMKDGQLTNGADVLFAKTPSRRLPQTRIRATVYSTDKGGDFADDRLFEGCAFTLLDQVFGFVQQHVRIAAEFKTGKVARDDKPQFPFAALREGLINAIIHRDYSVFAGGMSVGIYPNRIEIWNTGKLPKELRIADLKKVHPSLPANPHMAHVFYLRGIIERVGRGTLKIVEECKSAGLRAPRWKESQHGITLTFIAETRALRLNSRQKQLLESLNPGESLKPRDYYEQMAGIVSQRQAQRDLSELESGGWLSQEGDGPATVYVRTDQEVP